MLASWLFSSARHFFLGAHKLFAFLTLLGGGGHGRFVRQVRDKLSEQERVYREELQKGASTREVFQKVQIHAIYIRTKTCCLLFGAVCPTPSWNAIVCASVRHIEYQYRQDKESALTGPKPASRAVSCYRMQPARVHATRPPPHSTSGLLQAMPTVPG